MKRVAAAYSLKSQPAAADSSMFLDCFYSVLRARGEESAAMPQEWADSGLVHANK
jgi:hypothetical protein